MIPVAAAGADAKWTDAELHAAMVANFSLWANVPQWKVWLLVATEHVGAYRGIMFDYTDTHQRQGCAVFYNAIAGSAPYDQRAQLRTYVHEIGHAFNLLHSWQKNLADPPQPLGDNSGFGDLSWMNYTGTTSRRPGPAAMPPTGGRSRSSSPTTRSSTSGTGCTTTSSWARTVRQGRRRGRSGHLLRSRGGPLRAGLEVRSKRNFGYGEPVVVEIKLAATDTRGTATHGYLHPNDDFTTIAIRQPSGRTVLYRPMLRHCADEHREVRVGADLALYKSAYIGHGRDGGYFEQPGRYAIRAAYVAADGSRIVSPVTELRVRPPVTARDEEVGELLMGDEQGQLLALLGSDSEHLAGGNEALDELLEKHSNHPLATFARLTKGVNAARVFKTILPDKRGHGARRRPERCDDGSHRRREGVRRGGWRGQPHAQLRHAHARAGGGQVRRREEGAGDARLDAQGLQGPRRQGRGRREGAPTGGRRQGGHPG